MRWIAVFAAAFAVLAGAGARSDVGAKDFQIVARTLTMLNPKPGGRVTLAVVHAPGVPASRQEADRVAALLGAGLSAGGVTLVPVMVPVDRLQALDGATVAFVTSGLAAYRDAVYEATRARRLPSITPDFDCVRAARCVLGVHAEPAVEILLSKTAAEQSGVAFASAFRLLVSEI